MKIYIVMEIVDLGGDIVNAHYSKYSAEQKVDSLQKEYFASQYSAVSKLPNYTPEQARQWCEKNCPGHFYFIETELFP
jgi:hypothetical protein